MNKEKVKFALQDFNEFIDDEDVELAIAKCCFLSTKPNTHGLVITEEVLRRDAHTILGKFLIGNMDFIESDVKGHETKPEIFGYFPENQEIEFVEKDGYVLAYAKAVVSKIYATSFYKIFVEDNFRNTSVEMVARYNEEDESLVEAFIICGLTSLGKEINGSCPDANMEIIRFSQDKAKEFYDKVSLSSKLNDFVKERKEKLVDKNYKIDESKESMVELKWKPSYPKKLAEAVTEATNCQDLVGSIYLLVEEGWEDAPQEHLKYPVMQLEGNTFVYNKCALENVKTIAQQLNKTEVLQKINSIYDKLNLIEKEGKSESMKDVKKKDEVMANPEDEKLEEGQLEEQALEKPEAQEKLEEKPEEDENIIMEEDDKEVDDEDDDEKETVEQLKEQLAEKDKEIEELQKFKDETLEAQKMSVVNTTLAKVKEHTDETTYAKFESTGKECKFEDVTAWKNEVLASIALNVLQKTEKNDEDFTRMSISKEDVKDSKGLWN